MIDADCLLAQMRFVWLFILGWAIMTYWWSKGHPWLSQQVSCEFSDGTIEVLPTDDL